MPEILRADGSALDIIAYTDNQSLYGAVHSMKQTLKKRLIVDIASIREMIERNEIKATRTEKKRQIHDVLTKLGVSSNELLNLLSTSKAISL